MTPAVDSPRYGFPRARRLTRPADYKNVFADARRSADFTFTVLYRRSQSVPRLGLAISRKQLRRAVDRNRIKRIVRESFRLHAASLPAVDIVVLARQPAATAEARQLTRALSKHWNRIRNDATASDTAH